MPEIHVLPKDISELIAAGEVIERPASVLKELTENAIDSGAKRITAELKRGGVLYLRVTDDGCGIPPEQVRTAFLRHATSKINGKEDLESILTLGFRGEALASVCAVSRTELLTRPAEQELGTHYLIEGGEETVLEQTGCPAGTTVIVRDLFYNVPVRAGFLKKDTAEGNAAANIFQKIALSHPEISFRLIRENKTEFVTPGDGQLYSAVYAIFGKDFARDLLPVQYTEPDSGFVTVDGYIMKPLYARPNRAYQLFFVNGRSVRSFTLISAIEEAYRTLIMTGKYPACVLRVQVSPRVVDVNMHPTKAEVRFSDERRIYQAVYFAVLSSLQQNHLIYEFQLPQQETPPQTAESLLPKKPKTDWFAPVPGQDSNTPQPLFAKQQDIQQVQTAPVQPVSAPVEQIPEKSPQTPQVPAQPQQDTENIPAQTVHSAVAVPERPPVTAVQQTSPAPQQTVQIPQTAPVIPEALKAYPDLIRQPERSAELPERPEERNAALSEIQREKIRVIGELFDNYVLAEAGDQFVMIDKHAAHERILFERFRRRECRDRQVLLRPARVLLTADEIAAMKAQADTLERCGFSFDYSEEPVVQMTGVPMSCADLDPDALAAELAEGCRLELAEPDRHMLDDKFHDLACKAAIRAGDHNTTEELQSLAVQVWENEDIRHCPHGRPVLFLLSKYKIERQFKRIQD